MKSIAAPKQKSQKTNEVRNNFQVINFYKVAEQKIRERKVLTTCKVTSDGMNIFFIFYFIFGNGK